MHDLFHVHGAGRFVLFARDGLSEANVWKDTVLSAGETVGTPAGRDEPGRWMAHSHIAEHHEGG